MLYIALKSLSFKRFNYNYYIFINLDIRVIIAAYINNLLFTIRNRTTIV